MVTTNINQVNLRRLKAVATVCHTIAVQAGRLFRAYRSYKTKRLLQDLTDNQLRDIGLHRHDIARIVFGPTRTNH